MAPDLPAGMVTFLVTDVEGATRLLDRFPEAGFRTLDWYQQLTQSIVRSHQGITFSAAGDTLSSAFSNPVNAVQAAIDLQRRYVEQPIAEGGPLKVRVAIHSGAAEPHNGQYPAPTLYVTR